VIDDGNLEKHFFRESNFRLQRGQSSIYQLGQHPPKSSNLR